MFYKYRRATYEMSFLIFSKYDYVGRGGGARVGGEEMNGTGLKAFGTR